MPGSLNLTHSSTRQSLYTVRWVYVSAQLYLSPQHERSSDDPAGWGDTTTLPNHGWDSSEVKANQEWESEAVTPSSRAPEQHPTEPNGGSTEDLSLEWIASLQGKGGLKVRVHLSRQARFGGLLTFKEGEVFNGF